MPKTPSHIEPQNITRERYKQELREDQARWENYLLTKKAISNADFEKWAKQYLK